MPDVPYSIADIQNYFEFLIKKHETLAGNPSVQIYPNEIKNRIVFKVKTGYELELSSSKTMKLLGSSKNDVNQDNDGEDIPKLESVKVVLVHLIEQITIINKHRKYYLLLIQIKNLDS